MKKQTAHKIITFVFLLFLILPILSVNAAMQSNSSLYSNPNIDNGKNPYKFKVSDVVNSSVLTSVVGCTGVVNKVAKWMSTIMQSPEQIAKMAKDEVDKKKEQLKAACSSVKSGLEAAAGTVPMVNNLVKPLDTKLAKMPSCVDQVNAIDDKLIRAALDQEQETKSRDFKEQCFDGIAITLAKNQLTAMARSTMNWVNSGYGGNPLFVQNMKNLTYNLEKNVVETGIDVMLATENASPYAMDFAKTTFNNKGVMTSSSKFLGGLQSDLGNFITDPTSYYTDDQLNSAEDTRTVVQRAQDANNTFANNFSSGGWNGWLALTQTEKNNPLGFNIIASQYMNDIQAQARSDIKDEVTQNNGFMSQKECIQWQMYSGKDDKPINANRAGTALFIPTLTKTRPANLGPTNNKADYGKCFDWKVTTPGSLIKEKVGNYLNSPERQLELVKTINDSLNALFSVLISKLQSGGLTSLSDSAVNTNWEDNMNSLADKSSNNNNNYDNNGAYDNFNLTRDLGNTYVHEPAISYGTWNAKDNWTTTKNELNNNKKLYPSLNPEIYNATTKEPLLTNNAFYTVDTAGKTKLINDGYNDWKVGDRAFWNGTEWQDWKCGSKEENGECLDQKSPIAKRGVIQIQEDYIVAAKEILQILPKVMTGLGELDYCLPGPNPNYKINSTEAESAYQDWVGSMFAGAIDNSNERFGVRIDKEKDRTYENLHDIFKDNSATWVTIRQSMEPLIHEFSVICDRGESGNDCVDSYFYAKNGNMNKYQQSHLSEKNDLITATINETSNYMFSNFYEIFDPMMNNLYFKNITSMYLEKENKSIDIEKDKNPEYVPMAESGYDMTKDIMFYKDETNQKVEEYKAAITQAKVNIAKLQPIRDEVSGIIKAAQDRRKVQLDKLINQPNEQPKLECASVQDTCLKKLGADDTNTVITEKMHDTCLAEYNTCINDKTKSGEILSDAKLQELYNSCLAEENIQVYDADGIIGMGSKDEERCNDGIDNDLNGLIDSNDPACPQTTTNDMKCIPINDHDVTSYLLSCKNGSKECNGKLNTNNYTKNSCESRLDLNSCTKTEYIYAGPTYHQNWFDPYNSYKIKTCGWANVKPVPGQCSDVSGSSNEIHSYMSDTGCADGKCKGNLEASKYSSEICSRRGPNDCTATDVITAGPTISAFKILKPSTWDRYNAYTVNKCEWKN